jgi:Tfp pilus assembly pilus retraction ATPase PilT
MDVLRSTGKSGMERIKNEHTKEIMGVKGKPEIIENKTTMVWRCQKDARGENIKINYGMDTTREKKKRTSMKNMDGSSTSSHDKKFRIRSMEKQRGMAFGFRKMATAVINLDR